MSLALNEWLPPDAVNILLVLFLSFLIGLEREERKAAAERYAFGGVRTFPLIGLMAYAVAFLSGGTALAELVGFAVVAAFLLLSYANKVSGGGLAGITSEMAGLITYVVGALVFHRYLWIATTISVATMLLLQILQDLARGGGGQLGFLRQLRAATLDPGGRRHHPGVAAGRRLLLDRDDGRAGEEGVGRAATIPLCGRHPDGVRDDVPAAGCAAGDLQQGSDAPAGAGLHCARRRGDRRGLVLVAAERPAVRNGGQGAGTGQPARARSRVAVRAALPGDAGGHPARDPVPRRRGRLLAGCNHGPRRRRSVHHGHDASGGNIGPDQPGRIGDPDRGGQQQRRQGSLRLVFRRRPDGQAKHATAGRTVGD